MDKRYQVFVSSIYADLKEERQTILQTLMEMDCIPLGMEMFPATDEEQWEFIKKIIDDCDYYLLVIGGRYDTVSSDGISYTEKEYQYAVEKGIKVIAFLHESPENISIAKSYIDPALIGKLKEFRDTVATGRLVKFWKLPSDLAGLVALSLTKTIKMYPAIGWVRADSQSSSETLSEMNELRKDNEKLRLQATENSLRPKFKVDNLADLEVSIELFGTYKKIYQGSVYDWKSSLTWLDIYSAISPYLLENPNDSKVKGLVKKYAIEKVVSNSYSSELDDQTYQTIKLQFMALGLVKVSYSKTSAGRMALFWIMTESGKALMVQSRTKRSQ